MDQNKIWSSQTVEWLCSDEDPTDNWSPVGGREASSALRRMTERALQCGAHKLEIQLKTFKRKQLKWKWRSLTHLFVHYCTQSQTCYGSHIQNVTGIMNRPMCNISEKHALIGPTAQQAKLFTGKQTAVVFETMEKIIFGLPTFLSTFENLFAARLAGHAKHILDDLSH